MVSISGLTFIAKNLSERDIKDKRVLDVGSYSSSTGIRHLIESFHPAKYVGVDVRRGNDVDIVCDTENLESKFKENSFDIVISTEVVEHIRNWRKAISGMKHVVKPNGIILITTRSKGFEYHMSPQDYWRYEPEDMRKIFSDFKILKLEKDYLDPGVFVIVRKPLKFRENDLSNHELYNMVAGRRARTADTEGISSAYVSGLIKAHVKLAIYKAGQFIFSRKREI